MGAKKKTTTVAAEAEDLETGQPAVNQILHQQEPRVYKKRYVILVLFILLSASNGAQWIEYSIIAHIITHFYSVSYAAVDWTSMVYMLTYILFVIPASWLLDKYGLRVSILLGATGNALGAWIKLLSSEPDAFWITMIGQTIVGASQMFTLGIPPRLAAVWFGADQVSTACAAGVFGNQLGIAIGFVLPPLIVHMAESRAAIGYDLNVMFLLSAGLNTIILVLCICFFSDRPPIPPSRAQMAAEQVEGGGDKSDQGGYWSEFKQLAKSRDFVLLFLTYGINVGVFYAVSTLLSQMVLHYYPDEQESVGTIGLLIVVAGMAGSVVCGFVLDKFHKYKMTTLVVYIFSFLGMLSFTLTLDLKAIWIVFVNAFALGFFMTGYLPIGFEFASEITFPIGEGTSSGLLNLSAQIFGILLTLAMGQVMHSVSIFACNIASSAILVVGMLLTMLIKEDLRRQRALVSTKAIPNSQTAMTNYTNLSTSSHIQSPDDL